MDKKIKERLNMKLAEKIFKERKKLGLSQEQFAEQMEVSRQAVSKWESGQSMPDLDKIILMSNLFGVSTDYLLKEDSEQFRDRGKENILENDKEGNHQSERKECYGAKEPVTILNEDEVLEFMQVRNRAGIQITKAVIFCALGAVFLIGMEPIGLRAGWSEELVNLLSAVIVFGCMAGGITLFVVAGMALSRYDFLEKKDFDLAEELKSTLKKDYDDVHKKYTIKVTLGVILSIIAVIVMLVFTYITELTGNNLYEGCIGPIALLILVTTAVTFLVSIGIKHGGYEIILQMNHFSEEKKRQRREGRNNMSLVAAVYWCVVTAFFLGYGLLTLDWERSWIVWPIAGCLFGAVAAVISFRSRREEHR